MKWLINPYGHLLNKYGRNDLYLWKLVHALLGLIVFPPYKPHISRRHERVQPAPVQKLTAAPGARHLPTSGRKEAGETLVSRAGWS